MSATIRSGPGKGGVTPGTAQGAKPEVPDATGALNIAAVVSDAGAAGIKTDFIQESTTNAGLSLKIAAITALKLDDAAITLAAAAATAGKNLYAQTQAGGTATADTAGPAGADLNITLGAGAAGGAHTSNNPAGGKSGSMNVTLQAGGAAGSGGSGSAGKNGALNVIGALSRKTTVSAVTTTATLTAAQLLTGIVTVTHSAGANQNYTLPTGTLLDAAVDMAVDQAFEWTLINLSGTPATNTATIVAGTDHTIVGQTGCAIVGSATVELNTRRLITRKTATNTYVTYIC